MNSPVRAFKSVGCEPIFLVRAKGSKVYDLEGKEYIDYLGSWGVALLGHAPEEVVEKVKEEAKKGLSFGLTNPYEVKLAKEVVEAIPSVDKVRFVNSGTEATMSAIRLARGVKGRKFVVKFEGCYHGHYDSLLVSAGSGVATFGLPGTAGIPEEVARLTLVLPYNDTNALKEAFERYGEDIACAIVEPIAGNMGVVIPDLEFLKELRKLTQECGALLIFDEVITGFRVSLSGAQGLFKIEPDLTTLGKVLGGGFPVGAYGGREKIMKELAPEGSIYQAGTLSGNPIAMVAGYYTLLKVKEERPYQKLHERTKELAEGILSITKERGIPSTVNYATSMLTLFFTDEEVRDYESAKRSDLKLFAKFFKNLLEEGVLIPPSQFEAWFISTAHTKEDLERTLEKVERAIKRL